MDSAVPAIGPVSDIARVPEPTRRSVMKSQRSHNIVPSIRRGTLGAAARVVSTAILLVVSGACRDSTTVPTVPAEALPVSDAMLLNEAGDTVRLTVEVATSPTARAYGLMDRDSLGAHEGMLFIFEEDRTPDTAFYMYRTRIPLDIAFIDSEGRVASVMTMQPCTYPVPDFCPKYSPGVVYRSALEVNAGFFARQGMGTDARVEWTPPRLSR